MRDLFGNLDVPTLPSGVLASEFAEPPFSALDRRTGRWRDRAARWRSLGIASELGRQEGLLGGLARDYLKIKGREGDTSIFDPVVCELAYRWYTRPGDTVLDPFAGGSVRGVVAGCLGRRYVGIDLRDEQVIANRQQADTIIGADGVMPHWITGDADEMEALCSDVQADLVFTCPPYHDLEVYSDDPSDLSAMPWPDFEATYLRIISHAARHLADDRFMAIVIGDVRDRHGLYRGLPWLTIRAMQDAGLSFYQDAVLLDPHGSLQMIAGRTMRATRKLTRLHQYLLVGVKGSPERAARRLSEEPVTEQRDKHPRHKEDDSGLVQGR